MIILTLVALVVFQDPTVYRGTQGQLDVPIPRIEATANIDGVLDEAVWRQAARLTGFSQYQPVDGRPAEDVTDVLVWYAPDAIYFGIHATELHGDVVRATRANRDNITSEDQIQVLLDTYNDNRIAFLFGVNPLGVQADGTRSDQFGGGAGGRSATGGGMRNINPMEGNVDLNPDYKFDSAGQLVDDGYVVEIRIPFKSLRYQDTDVQTWGIHVLRRIPHSGYQDSWAPAVRANASFLEQAGRLTGLHDMRRGLVLEGAPTMTGRLDGSPEANDSWKYDRDVQLSGDIRWGIQQSLTMSGTINPDFSQIEADVGQVVLNERFALFFPEKRPFFLEGLELFDTPGQLIYTRQIVAPTVGVKLGGKIGRLNVGTILAADDKSYSANGDDAPLFAIARLRRDLPGNGTLGGVLTAREEGGDSSRLIGTDLRLYHSKLYYVELQAVQSWTETDGLTSSGPLLNATWDRTGRMWGFNYGVNAVAPDFRAAAGFVNRTGIIDIHAFNRLSFYGEEGALVETTGGFTRIARIWNYDDPGAGAIEGGESIFPSATFRGGWRISGSISRDFFSYTPASYEGYQVEGSGGEILPFNVPGKEDNQLSASIGLTTPTFKLFTATISFSRGQTPIFKEAAPGQSSRIDLLVDLRPTSSLRTTLQLTVLELLRRRDDSRFSKETIPRLKVEYQLTPAIFFRIIAQYASRDQAALVDREGRPIIIDGETSVSSTSRVLQADWLFSYRPSPGTLIYLGYGTTLDDVGQRRFQNLDRLNDGFFTKLSYLFRV